MSQKNLVFLGGVQFFLADNSRRYSEDVIVEFPFVCLGFVLRDTGFFKTLLVLVEAWNFTMCGFDSMVSSGMKQIKQNPNNTQHV